MTSTGGTVRREHKHFYRFFKYKAKTSELVYLRSVRSQRGACQASLLNASDLQAEA